jgi:photosynthetic reaction center cytochrome c subunit
MKLPSKVGMFAGAAAWICVAFAQTPAATKPQMAEQVFKNIQVLKGIPVDEFMGTMGLFSAALTVCCGDCHTGAGTSNPKWEDDPPRKLMARRMIQMVNTINKDSFGGRQVVTCWTCHRGTPNPAVTPSIDAIYGEPVIVPPDIAIPASANAGAPTVDQVLDKYIQALGGTDLLSKLTSFTAKGTSKLFGEDRTDPVEIYAKAPNQFATIIHQREGDLARTFDGRDAWVMLPLTVTPEYPLTAGALEAAKLDAELVFPARIKQFFSTWRVGFPTSLDGRDVNVLQATGAGRFIATFYFDKQSGLLIRVIHYAPSAVGRVPTQMDYSDYRPVAGVMLPFKLTYGWVSGREEYTLTDVQPNVSIDAAKFGKPVSRAQ